jgi:hypothetical protein
MNGQAVTMKIIGQCNVNPHYDISDKKSNARGYGCGVEYPEKTTDLPQITKNLYHKILH